MEREKILNQIKEEIIFSTKRGWKHVCYRSYTLTSNKELRKGIILELKAQGYKVKWLRFQEMLHIEW